jgi:hypothetical protein
MRMMTGRQACVVCIGRYAQKVRFHQRFQYPLAHRPLDAAQTLYLFGRQP